MRIGIYVQPACVSQPTGIGKHITALLRAMDRIDADHEYILYYPSESRRPVGVAAGLGTRFRERPVWAPRNWHFNHPRLWWNWYLPWRAASDHIQLFHGPNHFTPQLTAIPSIVTIHDLAYFRMRVHGEAHDAALRTMTRRSLDLAAAVIALSENTRADVVGLGIPREKVHVIYGGGNIVEEDGIAYPRMEEMRRRYGLAAPYILYVGALQPRKNVPFLVRAFARWRRQAGCAMQLVLTGPRQNAFAAIESTIQEEGVAEHVVITDYVDDWVLPLLYKGAEAFVLPSHYEGFTLVTIEAMAYGVPVIATDCSSIREGTGDAAELVGCDDLDGLVDALNRVVYNQGLRESMIRAGLLRAQQFTWERAARRTLQLYSDVASSA